MTWIMLDEPSFILFMSCTAGFFLLLCVMIIIFGKMPKAARTIISCWLFKRFLVIDADDASLFIFKAFKRGGTEGQFERQDKEYIEVKVAPRSSNPIASAHYHLEGTGIPASLSYMGKNILSNPQMLAAMQIAKTPKEDREKLPDEVKKWAKEHKIPVEKLVTRGKGDEKKEKRVTVETTLFDIEPRDLATFCSGVYDQGQIRIRLKQEYLKGLRRGKQLIGPIGKFAIPIGLVIVVIIVVIWIGSGGLKMLGM